jgi:hypothetical protein
MTFALPSADTFDRLLGDLLGRKVSSRVCGPNERVRYPFGAAVYDSADHTLTVVVLYELGTACSLAAALSLLPPAVAAESVKSGTLSEQLRENFHEVMNVASHYLAGTGLRISLQTVFPPPEVAPPKLLKGALTGASRIDLELSIAGYEGGRLCFVALV